MKEKLGRLPLFTFLLPVFFVFHGFAEHLFYVDFLDAISLLLLYVVIEIIFFLLFLGVYKNSVHSSLITFVIFIIYFFFGALQDFIKGSAPSYFSKYSFLLPCVILVLIIFFVFIRRIVIEIKFSLYLNILFFLLIFFDLATITYKVLNNKSKDFIVYESSAMLKPSVYLLILDEYAGVEQLHGSFHFENNLTDSLSTLGFEVLKGSKSNYNATPFSMASMLSMSYLNELKNYEYNDKNLNFCYRKLAQSNVVSGFKSLNYKFINYSIFDIQGNRSIINKTFLKSGTDLITCQTLLSRIKKDLYNNFLMKYFRHSSKYRTFIMQDYYNNELLFKKTIESVQTSSTQPIFMYTHLLMPHFPYYFNAQAKLNDIEKLGPENMDSKKLYIEYLQYVNNRVLNLVNKIMQNDKTSIILLLSDHGFRYAHDGSLVYSNLSAIYDSKHLVKNYTSSTTNVNVFRILFNDLFNTHLRLLPDKQF